MEQKTPKDDQERLRLFNLPFELLRGHVCCKPMGGIRSRNNKWTFYGRVDGKTKRRSFVTESAAYEYRRTWVYEQPFDRCGTVYVQFGTEILCRARNGSKWWMDAKDKDLLELATWNKNAYGYITALFRGQCNMMHRLIMKRIVAPDNEKPYVDHVNHVRHDNRRSNLRWASTIQNSNNTSSRGKISGRTAVYHNTQYYSFIAVCEKGREYFSYEPGNFMDGKRAWNEAVAARINYEKKHPSMHKNHVDYLKETPLCYEYWKSMQLLVRKNKDQYNRQRREQYARKHAQKRKISPVTLHSQYRVSSRVITLSKSESLTHDIYNETP